MNSPIYPPELDNPEFRAKWAEYEEYRRQRKLAKLQPKTVKSRFELYATWGSEATIEALDEAMRQQYMGVFPPKSIRYGANKPKTGPSEFSGAF